MSRLQGLLAAALILGLSSAANALADYSMVVDAGGSVATVYDLEAAGLAHYDHSTEGGTWSLNGPTMLGGFQINSWSSSYDKDPFVTNNVNVTNISAVPQIFTVTVLSPVVAQLPSTTMLGSVGVTLTNTADASATLTSFAPNPVYTALIDGAPVQPLLSNPYTLTCPPPGAGPFCSTSDSALFGPVGGPGALSTIGITIQFTLSPGDSAGITSVFNITAVPEPGTLLLVGGGLVGLAFGGRRRAA